MTLRLGQYFYAFSSARPFLLSGPSILDSLEYKYSHLNLYIRKKGQELRESSFKLKIIKCQNDALELLDSTRFREYFVSRPVNVTYVTLTVLVITVNYFAFRRQFSITQNIFNLIGICIYDVKGG